MGGGGSRPGRAGVVSYSLEDYDGLTKDDSYVVMETQKSIDIIINILHTLFLQYIVVNNIHLKS